VSFIFRQKGMGFYPFGIKKKDKFKDNCVKKGHFLPFLGATKAQKHLKRV
jgi:hypothetical protein